MASWWWLLVVPIAPLMLWFHRRSYAHLERWAGNASLAIRAGLVLLLIAALSGPIWTRHSQARHLVVLLDVSSSVSSENVDASIAAVDRLAQNAFASPGDRVSIVAFGERPRILRQGRSEWEDWTEDELDLIRHRTRLESARRDRAELLTTGSDGLEAIELRIGRIEEFAERCVGERTSLERALRLGGNLSIPGRQTTLCLITDGAENLGDWTRAAPEDEITLHVVALDRPEPPEVLATSISTPQHVRVHQTITPRLVLTSSVQTRARLQIFADGFAVEQREVDLIPGRNSFDLAGRSFDTRGFHSIEVLVESEQDTKLENNVTSTLVFVPGKARVLYVDGEERHIPHLKTALELEGFDVDARPAAGVPDDLTELLGYDAFILSNVPADHVAARQMQMIRSYVRDFGGGFIMIGGDESFGLGGYFQTPVEEILPVRMPIRKDLTRPSLALFLVIDKSGSMEGVKIQLAKRAALATADVINPRDQIGVVGFDGGARVLLPLTPALDRAQISSSVGNLSAGGGTFLYPALQAAQRGLLESAARRKHVLVLSDGQTQGFGYDELVREMAADGVTVSAIGIGEGADMQLMETIAAMGGGRAYFTNDFFSIPQIFTREALRAANNMLVERLLAPVAVASDPALEEIDGDDLPLLTGYVATSAKAAADVAIVSDVGDPILARWRFGLGQTVAFTSETKPRWAEDWLDWPGFTKFWGQLVRSVTGSDLDRSMTVHPSQVAAGDGIDLIAEVEDSRGEFVDDVSVVLRGIDSAGAVTGLEVVQEAPGRFRSHLADIPFGGEGRFVWEVRQGSAEALSVSYAVAFPYPPELGSLGPDRAVLEDIAAAADKPLISVDGNVELSRAASAGTRIELWPFLLALSVLLAPFDILVRRLG